MPETIAVVGGDGGVGVQGEARLIATRGAARWLDTPLARCDEHDLVERWRADPGVGARLLARLCWLAFVDVEVELEAPQGEPGSGAGLPDVQWTELVDGVARFELLAYGDRGAAGALAVEVGLAFLAWTAAADEPAEYDPHAGAVAAIYLGLGVLVASAIAADPGDDAAMELEEATFLLAAQVVTRGADRAALATLPADVRTRLAAELAALTPRRAELRRLLAIDPDAPRPALEREASPAAPRVAAARRPRRRSTRSAGHTSSNGWASPRPATTRGPIRGGRRRPGGEAVPGRSAARAAVGHAGPSGAQHDGPQHDELPPGLTASMVAEAT